MKKFLIGIISVLSIYSISYSKGEEVYCSDKKIKVDFMIKDVIKTEHQLVPKYISYIDISNIDDFLIAKKSLSLLINANSLINDDLSIFINDNEKFKKDIIDLAVKLGIKKDKIYFYKTKQEMIAKILKIRNGKNDLLSNRVALFTKSSNVRLEYAKIIDALEEYVNTIIVDNYSYLDVPRSDLLKVSNEEKEKIYKEIKCNYEK
ncbi:hypothetical protein [Oceanivirga salmonicida]|uniref:hypothetical protein n=1 Tax=Oceanivirga salmonicida TaxID=1769291 RepID=UPI00082A26CB|nr:hypothetical protein [Oceanivirga salmonicida]